MRRTATAIAEAADASSSVASPWLLGLIPLIAQIVAIRRKYGEDVSKWVQAKRRLAEAMAGGAERQIKIEEALPLLTFTVQKITEMVASNAETHEETRRLLRRLQVDLERLQRSNERDAQRQITQMEADDDPEEF